MKKTKILFSLAVCGVVLGAAHSTALAADPTITTNGTIEWVAPSGPGEVIKPEVPGVVIEPGDGANTGGPLRIQHVPDFKFGQQEIKVGAQSFNPTLAPYAYKEAEAQPGAEIGTEYYIPHFVQVTDLRGDNTGWDLRVSATKFYNATADDTLENATITFHTGARLSNDIHDDATIAGRINVFNQDLVIPMEGKDTKSVLATKDMEKENTTNGTQTSLVLDKDYLATNVGEYKVTDVNKGVTFNKTKDDIAAIGQYESTITWTLTDVL